MSEESYERHKDVCHDGHECPFDDWVSCEQDMVERLRIRVKDEKQIKHNILSKVAIANERDDEELRRARRLLGDPTVSSVWGNITREEAIKKAEQFYNLSHRYFDGYVAERDQRIELDERWNNLSVLLASFQP